MWVVTGRGELSGLLEQEQRTFILVDKWFLVYPTQNVLNSVQVRRYMRLLERQVARYRWDRE